MITKADGASAAELHALRSKLSVADAERRVSEIKTAWRKALVGGSDEAVDALERDLSSANREVERTAAAIEELDARIAAAERAELAADLDARTAEAKKRCGEMSEDFASLRTSLDDAARTMARLYQGYAFIEETNRELMKHARATVATPHDLFQQKFGTAGPPVFVVRVNYHPDGYQLGEDLEKLAVICRDA